MGEHPLSRRDLLKIGVAGLMAGPALAAAPDATDEPYLTLPENFRDVSRGTPVPHKLPPEKKKEVGLTRETWKVEVRPDSEHPPEIGGPVTLDFNGLMKLAETKKTSFLKIMTCNNIGIPLGMGLWEGVPLRDVIWLTRPAGDVRRVYYYGYHNDDPKQMFRSSLPVGRILEDPPGLPPVLLCYKLNGRWLQSERGGPVRVLVPEAYGFKSVKWITNIVLSNLYHANDTYAGGNNDIDSHLKTFARTVLAPKKVGANEPIRLRGIAQVGVSGLSKVQTWIAKGGEPWPKDDPYYARAPWKDAKILSAPTDWGGGLPDGKLPSTPWGFDSATGRPKEWPMRLAKAEWTAQLPGLPAGKYYLHCRTIDANGNAQPMPRPFKKSGRAAIERRFLRVV